MKTKTINGLLPTLKTSKEPFTTHKANGSTIVTQGLDWHYLPIEIEETDISLSLPNPYFPEETAVTINSIDLAIILKRVMPFTNIKDNRLQEIAGVLVEFDNGIIRLTATNNHAVSRWECPVSGKLKDFQFSPLLAKKLLTRIVKEKTKTSTVLLAVQNGIIYVKYCGGDGAISVFQGKAYPYQLSTKTVINMILERCPKEQTYILFTKDVNATLKRRSDRFDKKTLKAGGIAVWFHNFSKQPDTLQMTFKLGASYSPEITDYFQIHKTVYPFFMLNLQLFLDVLSVYDMPELWVYVTQADKPVFFSFPLTGIFFDEGYIPKVENNCFIILPTYDRSFVETNKKNGFN